MKGLMVICPGCRKSFHSTTEAFNPHKPANGSMVRLKDPWRKWGWCSFGDGADGRPPDIAERQTTYHTQMDCPGCCAPLAPSGYLTVKHPDGSEFIPEPEPEPIDNTVDGKLVFGTNYSDLEAEWNNMRKSIPVLVPGPPEGETRDAKITRLRSEGLSLARIGEEVGLSGTMVGKILKSMEVSR